MKKKIWTITELMELIHENYILDKTVFPGLSDPDLKIKKKIIRVIQEDLVEGKDYTKKGRDYTFSEQTAKDLVYNNETLREYLMKSMNDLEKDNLKEFKRFFQKETEKMNREYFVGFQNYQEQQDAPVSIDERIAIRDREDIQLATSYLLKALFPSSDSKEIFDYFGLDFDSYVADCKNLEQLYDESDVKSPYHIADENKPSPYDQSYAYYHYKVMRPLIYYRKQESKINVCKKISIIGK